MKQATLLLLLFFLAACTPSSPNQVIALVGGTIFSSPDTPPLEDAIVLIEDGRILEVGLRTSTQVPQDADVIDVDGMSILAGFWNTHVHFSGDQWENAATRDADFLSAALEEMLLRWGFVHVVDTGSLLENTLALRERIRSGELPGPEILTTGMPFAPPDGNPFYVEPVQLHQFTTPDQAGEAVEAHFAAGADLLKLFVGFHHIVEVGVQAGFEFMYDQVAKLFE